MLPFGCSLERLWNLLLTLGALAIPIQVYLKFFLRRVEFPHNDIVYNYAPFRAWYLNELRQGTLPIWDPFVGLGRFAEKWTTVPVDLFTPLEWLFPRLQFTDILGLQLILLFGATFVVFRMLDFKPSLSLLGMLVFLGAALTNYFLFFYMHAWGFLFYLAGFCGFFFFLQAGRLLTLSFSSLFLAIFASGCKLELLFYAGTSLCVGAVLFMLFNRERHPFLKLVGIGATLLISLCVHAWSINLILISASASVRTEIPPFSLSGLFDSCVALVMDWEFYAISLSATLAVFGKSLLRWARGIDPSALSRFFSGVLILVYYFCRATPGDLEEMKQMHVINPVLLGCLLLFVPAALALTWKQSLTRWAFAHLIGLCLLRKVGFIFLSHFFGVLWLPSRDNFLADLPFAVLAMQGIGAVVFERLENFSRALSEGIVFILIVLCLCSRLFYSRFGLIRHPLLSQSIHESWAPWKRVSQSQSWPPRVLSFHHGFNHLVGVSDVREYDSLLTSRYARYSLFERLGYHAGPFHYLGGFTGAISDKTARLGRIFSPFVSTPTDLRNTLYYFYMVHAVPPLDCDQLEFLGVEYVETSSSGYAGPNSILMNGLYGSFYPMSNPARLQKSIQEKIVRCQWSTVQIGGRSFWKMNNPLPRAFFVSDVRWDEARALHGHGLQTAAGKVILKDAKELAWEPVQVKSFHPNEVILDVNAKKPGLVVLTDLFDKHWRVNVNDKESVIHPLFQLVRAVEIGSGVQRIRFHLPYPRKAAVLWITLLGVGGWIALFFIARRFKTIA